MLTKTFLSLSGTWALATIVPNVATAQGSLGVVERTAKPGFIEPLGPNRVIHSGDARLPQFCATSSRRRCPPVVSSRALPGGAGMTGDFGQSFRNVRVSFYVDEISNEIVANGGANVAALALAGWQTSSPEADVQNGGPYTWSLPEPGQTFSNLGQDVDSPSGLLIYDALVFNACGTFSSFPVDHEATVEEPVGTVIGTFAQTDPSTIDSTGFYTLSYTIRAEDADGGVSDFRVEGVVAAICSGLNAL